MNNKEKKQTSLIKKFVIMVVVFGVISLAMNSIYTYISQTLSYHRESEESLKLITGYLDKCIEEEGEDFKEIRNYFAKHHDEMLVPADFDNNYKPAREEFEKIFTEEYPGKIYGTDIKFQDLSDRAKSAYVLYRYEYWMSLFRNVQDRFGLAFTYFIYPLDDSNVSYMIDPLPPEKEIEGKKYYSLGEPVFEDPEKYPMMWEAWKTGSAPSGFDVFDNEFGHNYAYYSPVVIDGEIVGLVGAEITVASVTSAILRAVGTQIIGYTIVLLISILIMVSQVRKKIIDRLLSLEKSIKKYSENKDTVVAEYIVKHEHGNDEIRSISDHFVAMIYELEDYMNNLQKVTAEKERISAELNVATQIQADMLPSIFPPFPSHKEFDLFASMDPAKEVGGDFYDFFLVDKDHIALVVADVSGKGVPAALFMVIAKTLIKNRTLMGGSPAEILQDVNNQLCEGNEAELFVTVWMAIIELSTGKGIAANAGHEHPALRRKDGSYELIKYRHSPAVATMEGLRFREHEFELHPGDTLVEYTDGVTEATNIDNVLFGEDRLLTALNQQPDAEPKDLLHTLREHIDQFVADAPQFDDITMLGFHYKGCQENDHTDNDESSLNTQ